MANITTKEAKKYEGKGVRIKLNGSTMFTYYFVKEIYRKHFITDSDTLHFDRIAEIKEIENE